MGPFDVDLIIQITGSRHWTDRNRIHQALLHTIYDREVEIERTLVVHGAAPGADTLAAEEAERLGCQVAAFPAHWEREGRRAGPLRNCRMLNYTICEQGREPGRAVTVLAFKADFGARANGGTEHMVRICREAGLHGKIIRR